MSGVAAAAQEYQVAPGALVGGEVTVPGDKSISHRALMLGGIAAGETRISGFLASEDCLATLGALRALGVRIERPEPTRVIVHGAGARGLRGSPEALDMGNAGTAMRLFMGLLAGRPFVSTLTGDASLLRRPMERVAGPLRQMGARITTQEGRPPVLLHGGQVLNGIDYVMPVASAQVKSALLLAGLAARGRTRVSEPAPTRDHTERMLAQFGVQLEREGATVSLIGGQALEGAAIEVPADFSSAAFFLVAGVLAAPQGLRLRNVGVNPTRTGLLTMLQMMGARITVQPRPGGAGTAGEPIADLEVHASRLRGIEVPPDLVPLAIDEFPVFFVAAACAQGETIVRGAAELRVKESDRLAVMAEGLATLGVDHTLLADGIRIRGGQGFQGGTVNSHGDHRIAMAFAVAGLKASAPIRILDVANVATSFPGFVALAQSIGIGITAA